MKKDKILIDKEDFKLIIKKLSELEKKINAKEPKSDIKIG